MDPRDLKSKDAGPRAETQRLLDLQAVSRADNNVKLNVALFPAPKLTQTNLLASHLMPGVFNFRVPAPTTVTAATTASSRHGVSVTSAPRIIPAKPTAARTLFHLQDAAIRPLPASMVRFASEVPLAAATQHNMLAPTPPATKTITPAGPKTKDVN